jgi:hypothetical protein
MASSSVLNTFRTNLKTQLSARGGLSGVQVRAYPPAADDYNAAEAIFLADADLSQSHLAMTGRRLEDASVELVVYARKAGDGDTVAAAAEARALALFAQVEGQLGTDDSVNGAVMEAQVGDYTVEHTGDQASRICMVRAQITYREPLD